MGYYDVKQTHAQNDIIYQIIIQLVHIVTLHLDSNTAKKNIQLKTLYGMRGKSRDQFAKVAVKGASKVNEQLCNV